VKLFADDVKLYAEISTNADVADLSRALSCTAEWADMWQLQISVTKCCVIHLNPKYVYSPVKQLAFNGVEFYLYPTVGTVLIHSVKPELTE